MSNIDLLVATFDVGDYCGPFEISLQGEYADYFTIRDRNLYLSKSIDQFEPGDTISVDICSIDPVNRLEKQCDTYTLDLVDCDLSSCLNEVGLGGLPDIDTDQYIDYDLLFSEFFMRKHNTTLCQPVGKDFIVIPGQHYYLAIEKYTKLYENIYENYYVRLFFNINIVYPDGESYSFMEDMYYNQVAKFIPQNVYQEKVLDVLNEGDEFYFHLYPTKFQVSYSNSENDYGTYDIDIPFGYLWTSDKYKLTCENNTSTTQLPVTSTSTTTTVTQRPYWITSLPDTCAIKQGGNEYLIGIAYEIRGSTPTGYFYDGINQYEFDDWFQVINNISYNGMSDNSFIGSGFLLLIQNIEIGGQDYYFAWLIYHDGVKPAIWSLVLYGWEVAGDGATSSCWGCLEGQCIQSIPKYNHNLDDNVELSEDFVRNGNTFRSNLWQLFSCEELLSTGVVEYDQCFASIGDTIVGILSNDNSTYSSYCRCLLPEGPSCYYDNPDDGCSQELVDTDIGFIQRYSEAGASFEQGGITVHPNPVFSGSENCTNCLTIVDGGGNELP